MSIEYRIGDVFDRLAEIPDGSVDLIVTSPPFLALRSYLPADHPDKHKEIGSEPTPAEFIDTLLALTAEWGRVLAPHGSICVELGDTFSGSGGAGGDYSNDDGLRAGQATFKQQRSDGWPLAKSLTGIPTLYAWSLAYGRNLLTGIESPAGQWRIRNVIVWARPNPPVGALGDKFRPATSYITVACKGAKRYFDLDAVRTAVAHPDAVATRPPTHPSTRPMAKYDASKSSGAPPLDWHADDHPEDGDWLWKLSTQPYKGSHYATYPLRLPTRLIEAMCPQRVCVTCGQASERIRENLSARRFADPMSPEEFGEEMVIAMRKAKITVDELAERVGVTPWMVRHWRGETNTPQLPSVKRWDELEVMMPFDHWVREKLRIVEAEFENIDRGNREVGGRLSGGAAPGDKPKVVATGWTDCGHDNYRTGVVLDPFAGSGTTLEAAQNVGRHAIGIDLDARNADLAQQRVGMFLDIKEAA